MTVEDSFVPAVRFRVRYETPRNIIVRRTILSVVTVVQPCSEHVASGLNEQESIVWSALITVLPQRLNMRRLNVLERFGTGLLPHSFPD